MEEHHEEGTHRGGAQGGARAVAEEDRMSRRKVHEEAPAKYGGGPFCASGLPADALTTKDRRKVTCGHCLIGIARERRAVRRRPR